MKQDDDVTERESIENNRENSERYVNHVRIQEKVETIWLFDTGADAHVMPKNVWELQTTKILLRGASGQDLGAIGEVQVRGFIGKIKVQFTAVVERDGRRCLLERNSEQRDTRSR